MNLMTSTPAQDDNVINYNEQNVSSYLLSLFDIDDFFIQTELENVQNNSDTTNESQITSLSLGAFENEAKLPDEEVVYIISKNVYKCDTCDNHYSNTLDLAKHQRVHTKTLNCHLCNDRFSNTFGLSRHMLRSHRREKRFRCSECDKAFHQLGQLTAHTRVHTGEKPYVCTTCQKTFAHYANLITHGKIHSQERPYECEICNRRFVRASNLIEHRKIHSGNKPYSCDMCENRYRRNSHLIEHRRIHTGERPYKCDICNETFAKSSDSNKHKKRCHK